MHADSVSRTGRRRLPWHGASSGFVDQSDLELAHRLAMLADEVALPCFLSSATDAHRKQDGSVVTAADLTVERAVVEHLTRHRPDDGILSEEAGTVSDGRGRWILDPSTAPPGSWPATTIGEPTSHWRSRELSPSRSSPGRCATGAGGHVAVKAPTSRMQLTRSIRAAHSADALWRQGWAADQVRGVFHPRIPRRPRGRRDRLRSGAPRRLAPMAAGTIASAINGEGSHARCADP